MIEITEQAESYLVDLLKKQENVLGVRIYINNPGTPRAETCIAYCREGDIQGDDLTHDYEGFKAWFDSRSMIFLEEAVVDFAQDQMGGQLTIKAPNAKMPQVNDDSPLEDRINYLLYNEVNPSLAAHGGEVSLVEITDDKFAVLRFGGGCQGCSMIDTTVKQGVEVMLKEAIPELVGVFDITDHSEGESPFFTG